jgi:[acyl-carrier-protein] S-malonyltransferase
MRRENFYMADLRKVAFIFPGQGSQQVGMGKEISETYKSARQTFEQANDILGFDIMKLCFEGPEEELKLTKNSQPAIFVNSIACFRAFQDADATIGSPAAVAGLSLGEFTANVAAGSFSFEDGLRLVRKRGEYMQDACDIEPSTMASIIGLDEHKVRDICASLQDKGVLDIGNLNCPGQIAISGSVEAIRNAMEAAEQSGAQKVVELEVSGAFHSRLMKPAEERLKDQVESTAIKAPVMPVIANYTARPVTTPEGIREAIIRQLCSPVLWEKSMRYLISEGFELFLEFGQGKVLRGLMRRIDKGRKVLNVQDPGSLEKTLDESKSESVPRKAREFQVF